MSGSGASGVRRLSYPVSGRRRRGGGAKAFRAVAEAAEPRHSGGPSKRNQGVGQVVLGWRGGVVLSESGVASMRDASKPEQSRSGAEAEPERSWSGAGAEPQAERRRSTGGEEAELRLRAERRRSRLRAGGVEAERRRSEGGAQAQRSSAGEAAYMRTHRSVFLYLPFSK